MNKDERTDLIYSYYQHVMNPAPEIHMPAAQTLAIHNLSCSFLIHNPTFLEKFLADKATLLSIARTYAHFSKHNFFVTENQLLINLTRIQRLPAIIVHGRYDVLCEAKSAYELHQNWPCSELILVDNAGHSAQEPEIAKALVVATDRILDRIIVG